MPILLWIILGGLAGWIASLIMKTNAQQGLLLGIVGAVIGGFVMNTIRPAGSERIQPV